MAPPSRSSTSEGLVAVSGGCPRTMGGAYETHLSTGSTGVIGAFTRRLHRAKFALPRRIASLTMAFEGRFKNWAVLPDRLHSG